MKPGRDLDALIAEKVMGWTRHYTPPSPIDGRDSVTWITAEGKTVYVAPQFSTDIAAAWEIRTKVKMWPFSGRMRFKKALQKIISERLQLTECLLNMEETILAVEPIDICLAALKAVGE